MKQQASSEAFEAAIYSVLIPLIMDKVLADSENELVRVKLTLYSLQLTKLIELYNSDGQLTFLTEAQAHNTQLENSQGTNTGNR